MWDYFGNQIYFDPMPDWLVLDSFVLIEVIGEFYSQCLLILSLTWNTKKLIHEKLFLVGSNVHVLTVGLSNVEMFTLNSTSFPAIVICSNLTRPFPLDTKHVLPCNASEQPRWGETHARTNGFYPCLKNVLNEYKYRHIWTYKLYVTLLAMKYYHYMFFHTCDAILKIELNYFIPGFFMCFRTIISK